MAKWALAHNAENFTLTGMRSATFAPPTTSPSRSATACVDQLPTPTTTLNSPNSKSKANSPSELCQGLSSHERFHCRSDDSSVEHRSRSIGVTKPHSTPSGHSQPTLLPVTIISRQVSEPPTLVGMAAPCSATSPLKSTLASPTGRRSRRCHHLQNRRPCR